MKGMKKLLAMAAMFAAAAGSNDMFEFGTRRNLPGPKESKEDRDRRMRCEQAAIEKAKAKRERKAAKYKETHK